MDVQFKRDKSLSIVRTHAILTTPGTVYTSLGSCSPWMYSLREIKVYLLKELMLFGLLQVQFLPGQVHVLQVIVIIDYNFVCMDY